MVRTHTPAGGIISPAGVLVYKGVNPGQKKGSALDQSWPKPQAPPRRRREQTSLVNRVTAPAAEPSRNKRRNPLPTDHAVLVDQLLPGKSFLLMPTSKPEKPPTTGRWSPA